MNVALFKPGTGLPSCSTPASGGNSVCGTGRPISADGSSEGSPLPSR